MSLILKKKKKFFVTCKIFWCTIVFLNEESFNPSNYFQLNYYETMKDLFKFITLNSVISTMKGVFLEFDDNEKEKPNKFRMESCRKTRDV